MRNKITNQLAGVTLFTSQLTTQNICDAEKVKEEKEDPPTGMTVRRKGPATGYFVGITDNYTSRPVSANSKLLNFTVII